MPAVVQPTFFVAFPSDLGWMAALGCGPALLRLTFGHSSPQAAIAALEVAGDGLSEPPSQPLWIATLQAFSRREISDLSEIVFALPKLTPFQRRVINLCREIPFGQTRTYAEMAAMAGSPGAARAVGNIMANNPLPLVVPCHRVVGSGGGWGGYSAPGGVATKVRLLKAEAGRTGTPARQSGQRAGVPVLHDS